MTDKTLDELRVELAKYREAHEASDSSKYCYVNQAAREIAIEDCERRIFERAANLNVRLEFGVYTYPELSRKNMLAELDRHRKALADSPGGPA